MAELGGPIMISVMTRVELEGGVARSSGDEASSRRSRMEAILQTVQSLDVDAATAEKYGAIVAAAGYSRRKVIDRLIAAQALLQDATLVTMTGDDFRDVPGLKLLVW